jgi:hypothetical protein
MLKTMPREEFATCELLSEALFHAHKYLIPPPRSLTTKVTEENADYIRMPFPELVFEYLVPDAQVRGITGTPENLETHKSTKRICLCIDLDNSFSAFASSIRRSLPEGETYPKGSIAFSTFFFLDTEKTWAPSMGVALWNPGLSADLSIDGYYNAFSYGVKPLFRVLAKQVAFREKWDLPKLEAVLRNDLHEDVAIALRMLALMNARNIEKLEVAKEPHKLNKKRLNLGKTPFFSYNTLSIFLSGDNIGFRKRIPSAYDIDKMFSDRTAKRLHAVSGHFKRRKSGLFWWNSFFRGVPSVGAVVASHQVPEKGLL